jgi:outer membrane protein assembly factor BamB
MKKGAGLLLLAFALFADAAYATYSFDFSCETPVEVNAELIGEIKYSCMVKNTGDSYLELGYQVQPEQNPIDPNVGIGFHPQPQKLYLQAGESQPITGFEVVPRISPGSEKSFDRTFNIVPVGAQAEAKQAVITTILKSRPLPEDARIFGNILDGETGKPVANAKISLKYKRFEPRRQPNRPDGHYDLKLPSFQYLLNVNANGYELFSEEIDIRNGNELNKDISLERASERGDYELIKKVQLDTGSWLGVWRGAVSENGQVVALGIGGEMLEQGNSEAYIYLFSIEGEEITKLKMPQAIRGVDLSADGSLVAVGLGETQHESSFEKVLIYKKSGELVWKKFLEDVAFHELRFSNDGRFVAVGDALGNLYLLNAADGAEIWKKFTRGQIRGIKFYDDDSHILVGSGDGYLYLFDIDGNEKWKTYIHSWPYGFIATTPGNDFSAAGGHMGYLHLIDKNGNDLLAYEAEGGFRWAEIGKDGSFMAGGTRNEFVLVKKSGKVVLKGPDAVSGAMTKDGKYIISGNQKAGLELRNNKGTLLWEYKTEGQEYGKDVRLSYISDDAKFIVGATKTGEVYFFKGGISQMPSEATQKESIGIAPQAPVHEPEYPPIPPERAERAPSIKENPLQNRLLWIAIPAGIIVLVAILLCISRKKQE